jgi:hypothetical protein
MMVICFRLDAELRYSSSDQSSVSSIKDLSQDYSMDSVLAGIMQAITPPTSDDEMELPDWEADMTQWIEDNVTPYPDSCQELNVGELNSERRGRTRNS